ncbi:FMN-dependent L-lactate dehydrogenase LldD [Caulobacter radicis]|uniref:FMN-dependent L-lactate dehydrogenase LldD n=1 Tax=Caulobacter radicis TaxID=2172650 RepID=UPI001AD81C13|nr:FMN-dependent L-lactate dehydrogenase LldD [Caulobacter radicis]
MVSSPLDFRRTARSRLPRFLFEYADGGAGAEMTLRANVDDLQRIGLRQRVLRDVADIDLSANLLGARRPLPLALGPIGIGGMFRRRGELQAARAATAAGLPFTLSTVGLCSLQEVRAATSGPLWFQLYVIRDRAFMADLIATAKTQGAEALVFTVDMPVPGSRYRDAHAGMAGPHAPLRRLAQAIGRPGWAWDVGLRGRPHQLGNLAPVLGQASGMSDYMGWLGANFDPSIAWADIGWLRAAWDGPLIIKGVLDPDDARAAVDAGADAIVVSNHGGRQLDGASSTAKALPAIADAVGERVAVLADSGVRTGLDVVRMLALGADGVLLGRAWLYALATDGETGVATLIALIEKEMRVAMALTGVNSIAQIDRSILLEG